VEDFDQNDTFARGDSTGNDHTNNGGELMDIQFPNTSNINFELLDEALRDQFGSQIDGISYSDVAGTATLMVHFKEGVNGESHRQRIQQILAAHNPNAKTTRQQEEEALNQQRQQNLANPLDPAAFGAANQPIRQLADRVAWLEKESVRLTGGGA